MPDESNDTLMTTLQCQLGGILAARAMGHHGTVLITFAAPVPPEPSYTGGRLDGWNSINKEPSYAEGATFLDTRTSRAPPSTPSVLDGETRRTPKVRNSHIAVTPRNSTASSVRTMVTSPSILPAPKTSRTRRENNCRSKNARGSAMVAFRSYGNRRTNQRTPTRILEPVHYYQGKDRRRASASDRHQG
ncbi:hypothetical protein HPB48_000706 [Haemaphysalis longicornis]|uniref:Uncharacterized protein n=1 Tax=Haemaphysalis longicornis TaxID=44386 RepID=A0A9J6FS20_HAELO|nr:hypothetical protein HPB48_000706 [Haemaphysalis longicornis]